ncbi:MAG: tolB protein [Nannocystaceae bacterium]
MRLIPFLRRFTGSWWRAPGLVLALVLYAVGPLAGAAEPAADPDDLLGELVVDAAKSGPARLVLPRLAVEAPLQETPLQARARAVVTRDLELSGELDVLPAARAVLRPLSAEAPVETGPWREHGLELLVRVHADRVPVGRVQLRAEIHLLRGTEPPLIAVVTGPMSAERLTTHRLADAVLRTVTGYEGPFASRLAFVVSEGGRRTVHVIDPDGDGEAARSGPGQLATAPAFDAAGVLHWAASVDGGRYRLYREHQAEALELEPAGSIYGLAFDPKGERAAISIATGGGIEVFLGTAELDDLQPTTQLQMALHPAFSPRGALAYAGTARLRQRIYVGGRPVSPAGVGASSPSFCRHPDGDRLLYAAGARDRSDLVGSDARGRDPVRLTKGQGRNSSPACSPDGRLVAFFSTRRTGDGPGLYLMRIDGRRPRKISDALGDSLQWSPRVRDETATAVEPETAPVETESP